MPQWLHALVPTTPGEWWTAIAAIVTAVAVVYAIRGTRYAASTLRIEQTPVLTLEHKHDDDSIRLRNIGRGVAQVALVTDEDGSLVHAASAMAPGAEVRIDSGGIEFSIFTGHFLFGQDIGGRWVRTFAIYRGLKRAESNQFQNRIDGSIRRWRVPRAALRDLRRDQRSVVQHLHTLGSYFSIEAWVHRGSSRGVASKIAYKRWWHGLGEERRQRRFASRADHEAVQGVPIGDRAAWEIDIDGFITCWAGMRIARQLSCAWEGDTLVCEILLHSGPLPSQARGILAIERAAYDLLPDERTVRNEMVRHRFDRYVCGLRPSGRFVFILKRYGTLLINRTL